LRCRQNGAVTTERLRWAWLRSPRFDTQLILGTTALAVCSGLLVVRQPQLFNLVLALDLWLLSYHHVIATFTRLDRAALGPDEHRLLVVILPLAIAVGAVGAVLSLGAWILPSVYLYWQWLHYTRQSYGVWRIYQAKAGAAPDRLGWAALYLVAAAGILYRSSQGWTRFLGMELRLIPVPASVAWAAGAVAGAVVLVWIGREATRAWRGRLDPAASLYLASHITIFGVGYFGLRDLDTGWLVVNIWHNAQYLLLVWLYNNNRFRGQAAPPRRFLAWLSQDGRAPLYFLGCLLITGVLYGVMNRLLGLLALSALPTMLVVYQTINFHHYLVDARIWKIRKKPLRQTLGIAA
jgi:hypothetical protein